MISLKKTNTTEHPNKALVGCSSLARYVVLGTFLVGALDSARYSAASVYHILSAMFCLTAIVIVLNGNEWLFNVLFTAIAFLGIYHFYRVYSCSTLKCVCFPGFSIPPIGMLSLVAGMVFCLFLQQVRTTKGMNFRLTCTVMVLLLTVFAFGRNCVADGMFILVPSLLEKHSLEEGSAKVVFQFRNVTSQPIDISRIESGCSCTTIEDFARRVRPNSIGSVVTEVDLTRVKSLLEFQDEVEFAVGISVYRDDKQVHTFTKGILVKK